MYYLFIYIYYKYIILYIYSFIFISPSSVCPQVSAELKACDPPSISVHIDEIAHSISDCSYNSRLTWTHTDSSEMHNDNRDPPAPPPPRPIYRRRDSHDDDDEEEDEIDPRKEKRTQKYLISMVTLFAMCWCPINILILVTHFVYESDDNSGHFDITYLTFTFFGFLSTCINPVLFASWHMSDRTKDRLRGYFRFSNRRRESAHAMVRRRTDSEGYSGGSPPPAAPPIAQPPSQRKADKENGHLLTTAAARPERLRLSPVVKPRRDGRRGGHEGSGKGTVASKH